MEMSFAVDAEAMATTEHKEREDGHDEKGSFSLGGVIGASMGAHP